ncbi:MAG: DUF3667 domain-containing protein, partial [Saprospiraceae bacterium]|nr:DUF3667 domain-containing protein [Saprospiraceae bacterium]
MPGNLKNCLNCGAPLEESDQYCGHCGQKTHDGKVPLLSMLHEFVSDQLNLDGKVLYTLKLLLTPGLLTTEYFAGKRKKQINPIRLFFFAMIVGLAVFQLSDSDLDLNSLKEVWGSTNKVQSLMTIDTLQSILSEHKILEADSILSDLKDRLMIRTDSIDLKNQDSIIFLFDYFENQVGGPLRISREDFAEKTPAQIVQQLEIKGLASIYFKQKIKLIKNPNSLLEYILRNLAWIYLAYIPVIAIVLKLLYIRKHRFYMEHFVFSLHLHTAFIIFLML